ncbi:hypothetical protein [Cohnella sp. WQ 127256]|uniref:hypothetical protein n=1 Tax=Cohnella sp. WQ 127256 TaxID=2938790 RepID=UPI0021199A1A|nr:hypothetical protein [Cohnella sp. WQ 127256]
MNNNWDNEEKLNSQRGKVQRLFIILSMIFLFILVVAIVIGYYFTGNTLRDICGTTNC